MRNAADHAAVCDRESGARPKSPRLFMRKLVRARGRACMTCAFLRSGGRGVEDLHAVCRLPSDEVETAEGEELRTDDRGRDPLALGRQARRAAPGLENRVVPIHAVEHVVLIRLPRLEIAVVAA